MEKIFSSFSPDASLSSLCVCLLLSLYNTGNTILVIILVTLRSFIQRAHGRERCEICSRVDVVVVDDDGDNRMVMSEKKSYTGIYLYSCNDGTFLSC